jgi:hypothetical protein
MLGWGQLFRGRSTRKWVEIQQTFLLTLVVDRRYFTGDMWVRKLINLLWKFTHSLWDARNLDRHGHSPLENQAICRNRLQASVHALYDSSPLMLVADQDIFFLPVEERLAAHHPDRIELRISRAKPVVATSIQDATQTIKRTFKYVADLFTRTRNHTLLEDKPPDSASGGSHFLGSLHRFLSPTIRPDPIPSLDTPPD